MNHDLGPWFALCLALLLTLGCEDPDDPADDDDVADDDDDDTGDDDDDDTGDDDDDDTGDDDDTVQGDFCPALPPATGNTVTLNDTQTGELMGRVADAQTGDTILLEDGEYNLHGDYLRFVVPGVTLRSASGNREAVILDGDYETTEIIQINAPDITIADLTLREAYYHPIHVSTSGADTTGTLIYNVHIIDAREQAIKINPHDDGYYTDDGEIACSHLELTDEGRPIVDNNCYTGGVDAHQSMGWHIRDNLIEGYWCDYGLSEHGIHLWRACRDTLVERNVLRNNARGIGFGLVEDAGARVYDDAPCGGETLVGHYDGMIRNNFVYADDSDLFDSEYGNDGGISLAQACGAQVVHNTVASTQTPFASIEFRFDHTDAVITNNLVTHNIMDRGGVAALSGNLEGASMSLFEDPSDGYLWLAAGASDAIDQGEAVPAGDCDYDYDGDPRDDGSPDIGADER